MSNQTDNQQQNNSIVELRTVLFDTLRGLGDKENPMDIDRAMAINSIAQTVVNTAKAEIDGLKILGGTGTGFIPALPPVKPSTKMIGGSDIEHQPGHTVHKMQG